MDTVEAFCGAGFNVDECIAIAGEETGLWDAGCGTGDTGEPPPPPHAVNKTAQVIALAYAFIRITVTKA